MARATKTRKTVEIKAADSSVMQAAAVEVMSSVPADAAMNGAEPQAAINESKEGGAKPATRGKKQQPAKVQLPQRLQINNLDGLYADLCKLVTGKKDHVVLDAGEVSLVDSAGVQLLVAFFRSFQNGGGTVEWDNYSVQLYQMADELGVSGQLGG